MNLQTSELFDLVEYLLKTSLSDIVMEWSGYDDRSKSKIVDGLEEARVFSQRTLFQTMQRFLDAKHLAPIRAFVVAWNIHNLKSMKEVKERLRREKLSPRDGVAFSEVQPTIFNSLNVLIKIYSLRSFEDAQIYIQTQRLVKPVKNRLTKEHVTALAMVHADYVSLLAWERTAQQLLPTMYDLNNQKELDYALNNFYPPLDLVISIVEQTWVIIEELGIFVPAILDMLREDQDFTHLFITVDSLYTAVKAVQEGHLSEDFIRQKIAFARLTHDFMVDSVYWSKMVVQTEQPTTSPT